MANLLYGKAREAYLLGNLDWVTNGMKAVLVNTVTGTVYTVAGNEDTHDFLDDVAAGARIDTAETIGNRTAVLGVADGDNVTFLLVAAGGAIEAIVIYNDTPTAESAKELVAYIDSATGLPVTPGGGDITVQWDNTGLDGAGGIFKL